MALLLLLLLFSSSSLSPALAAPPLHARRHVAHDDNMRDHVQGNKFLQNHASDDALAYPAMNEEALANSRCPKQVELRWQTEVSSSIYATPLITDLNTDGKLEIVVPSFVHYLEVLEGSDGEKLPGWPAYHQSTVHSSALMYDIDKDGIREVALATFNGEILFFRASGFIMGEKLVVPRRRVRKDWYVGLSPDHADRTQNDVHDDSLNILISNTTDHNAASPLHGINASLGGDIAQIPSESNVSSHTPSSSGTRRRILEEGEKQKATVENDDGNVLEDEADSSFDVFRSAEEIAEEHGDQGLSDHYSYDYDDYVDESMWADDSWSEAQHLKEADFIDIDAHILCTPVIADIDRDGVDELIVAASYFFDREYYDNPEHTKELPDGLDIGKYVGGSIVVFNLDTKQVKWTVELDLSTDSVSYRAYIYSSPTVVDVDEDGFLEIVVGTSFGFLYVLHHNGTLKLPFPHLMGEIQGQVVAGDINDDGKIEIVSADVRGNVAAWSGDGKELWTVHLKSIVAQGATIGDVDGDGHTDLVIPTASGKIFVLRGSDGSLVAPFPFRTHGRVMAPALLVDLNKQDAGRKGLTIAVTSFDGYFYLIEGSTGCADAIDIGETSYSMVLADNVDGGDDLDLIVTTMNGNVYCFQTPAPHHPLKAWPSQLQGRNVVASKQNREGIFVVPNSRNFRDEAGSNFWVQFKIVDQHRPMAGSPGSYNVTVTLLVPGNYQGPKRLVQNIIYTKPGAYQVKVPCVSVRTTGSVIVEMVDKNGLYFSDEFSLTFHMRYYRLLKWLICLPFLGMVSLLVLVHPPEGAPLPSFSHQL
ncbi:hypothetical protein KC19_3G044000 [Ceratodon purpureus]|uniref:DEX1 C-terminal domain-containing protein n=1 Tax=Ceratodon purpureus TaxID=3225 RepID=A0A8T0IID8_CERPU|nr:hypothetical protein KC19_3G044000 [Ceratodon purpureus]